MNDWARWAQDVVNEFLMQVRRLADAAEQIAAAAERVADASEQQENGQ